MSRRSVEVRLVSPPGRAALSAIALRGPGVQELLAECFVPLPRLGAPTYGRLRDAAGETIDDGVAIPASGDEILLTLHGNPRLVDRAFARLRELGATVGTADLGAWGESQVLASALRLTENAPTIAGGCFLLAQARRWEEWLDKTQRSEISTEELEAILARAPSAIPFTRPPRIALVGAPNAGKSTLLNRLLGWDRVVVDPTPGTTRDRIEVQGVLFDRPVVWIDGAGLRAGADALERAGMERVHEAARTADLIVHLIAAGPTEEEAPPPNLELPDRPTVRVASKVDLAGGAFPSLDVDYSLSAVTGEGLESFLRAVAETLFGGEDLPALLAPITTDQRDRLRAILDRRAAGRTEEDLWTAFSSPERGEKP